VSVVAGDRSAEGALEAALRGIASAAVAILRLRSVLVLPLHLLPSEIGQKANKPLNRKNCLPVTQRRSTPFSANGYNARRTAIRQNTPMSATSQQSMPGFWRFSACPLLFSEHFSEAVTGSTNMRV
jgi:hypothetical protein